MNVRIRAAAPDDLDAICDLLERAQLPIVGVAAHVNEFLVAEPESDSHDHEIIAAIGMERYDDAALLRSMVVQEAARGTGIGTRLVRAFEDLAKQHAVRSLVLLTTTADRWFATLGYEHITRDDVPPALLQSVEFRGACPASAVVMRKRL